MGPPKLSGRPGRTGGGAGAARGGASGAGITSNRASANNVGVVSGGPRRRSCWNRAWQVTSSMPAGTPAHTWRGLRGRPLASGAGGRVPRPGPGQCLVSAAYSSMASPRVSASAGSSAVMSDSAASMATPRTLTPPPDVQRSDWG